MLHNLNVIESHPMAENLQLSQEGYEKLKAELAELKGSERQKIAENIREAKSHGDLRENAMYHEAKLNQTRLESRIAELEHVLERATIIESPAEADVAHLGSKVTIKNKEWGDTMTIELVGAFEADPANDKISVASPLGEALMNKKVGEEVSVSTPGGEQIYTINEID